MASEETLQGKKAVFDGRKGTTHWPVSDLSFERSVADQ